MSDPNRYPRMWNDENPEPPEERDFEKEENDKLCAADERYDAERDS